MNRSLKKMTNEELWCLFPIILSEHNILWKDMYAKEKILLSQAAKPENIARISHIGSTSVPGLVSKPTIDILLEIKQNTDLEKLIFNIEASGYIYVPQLENPPPHMMFLKGYTPAGFKGQAFHVHIRYHGDWDELYFRDYLIKHADTAKEYGDLKLKLKDKFEHDRDSYTEAKTSFIKCVTAAARLESEPYA